MKQVLFSAIFIFLIPVHYSFTNEGVAKHNIHFELDSHALSSSGQAILRDVYANTPDNQYVRFGVKGPMSGDMSHHQRNALTDRRAKSILSHLDKMGILKKHAQIINVTNKYGNVNRDQFRDWNLEIEVFKEPELGMSVFASIEDVYPMPSQEFTIDPSEDNTLQGMDGTVVFIPADALQCADGSPATGRVKVELKEVYSKADIIMAGLHTMSAGRMLESGGTVYLMAYCGDNEARIKPGTAVDIDFPNQTGLPLKDDMKTFNAFETEGGEIDWYEASENTNASTSTVTERFYINDEEVDKETYMNLMDEWEMEKEVSAARERTAASAEALDAYLLSTGELGWINCDMFYDEPNVTNVIVQVNPDMNPSLRMVFDDINSVMAAEFISKDQMQFSQVPVGQRITIVGYSLMDDKAFFGKIPAIVANGASYNLKLDPTGKLQLENELFALN
jgi:hypothetical protein